MPANIRLGWKGLPGANALAYYVKSFITLAPWISCIRLTRRELTICCCHDKEKQFYNIGPWISGIRLTRCDLTIGCYRDKEKQFYNIQTGTVRRDFAMSRLSSTKSTTQFVSIVAIRDRALKVCKSIFLHLWKHWVFA